MGELLARSAGCAPASTRRACPHRRRRRRSTPRASGSTSRRIGRSRSHRTAPSRRCGSRRTEWSIVSVPHSQPRPTDHASPARDRRVGTDVRTRPEPAARAHGPHPPQARGRALPAATLHHRLGCRLPVRTDGTCCNGRALRTRQHPCAFARTRSTDEPMNASRSHQPSTVDHVRRGLTVVGPLLVLAYRLGIDRGPRHDGDRQRRARDGGRHRRRGHRQLACRHRDVDRRGARASTTSTPNRCTRCGSRPRPIWWQCCCWRRSASR